MKVAIAADERIGLDPLLGIAACNFKWVGEFRNREGAAVPTAPVQNRGCGVPHTFRSNVAGPPRFRAKKPRNGTNKTLNCINVFVEQMRVTFGVRNLRRRL